VSVEVEPVRVRRGAQASAVVRLSIAAPLHVNANPATHTHLIPTQLTMQGAPVAGITVGDPVYPAAVTRKFAFDESPLRVYEGTIEIKLPVRATLDATPGEHTIPARVRVQPCDEEVCYPPRTIETKTPVVITG
jgi:hypothetical protein